MNNLTVITTTSDEYTDCFGFTEKEVFVSMDEYGMENKEEVKKWYDGFTFGGKSSAARKQEYKNAVWSLLLASGYLKVVYIEDDDYELQ